MKGRFNLFQTTMLRWRDLYPYSAVHVIRVGAPLDRARLEAAIAGEFAHAGLAGLAMSRTRYEYAGGAPAVPLDVHAARGDDAALLEREIERQLNQPFSTSPPQPFRCFALDRGDDFRLGLAYDHFVAGGDSIALLLRDVADRYLGQRADTPPPERYPPTLARLALRHPLRVLTGLPWLARIVASCRRSLRPRYGDFNDGYNGFVAVPFDAAESAALLRRAKAWGVTFNDLVLALTLHALGPLLAGDRRAGKRRNEVAVASIVNLRQDIGATVRGTFGQFLGSLRFSHPLPPDVDVETLARDVHRETAAVKARKLYLPMLVGLAFNRVVWFFLDTRQRQRMYAKAYPVWAGITTLNANAVWKAASGPLDDPDYLRGVSTGPTAPLVVAVTTAGATIRAGLSYRRSSFTPENVARIAATLREFARSCC